MFVPEFLVAWIQLDVRHYVVLTSGYSPNYCLLIRLQQCGYSSSVHSLPTELGLT